METKFNRGDAVKLAYVPNSPTMYVRKQSAASLLGVEVIWFTQDGSMWRMSYDPDELIPVEATE